MAARWQSGWWGRLPVLLCVGGLVVACDRTGGLPPARDEMRRHRMAQLTTDELRALRVQAEGQRLQARWAGQAEMAARCADLEYRQQNEVDCAAATLGAGERAAIAAPEPSTEVIFEELLLGRCLKAKDRREAREWHCLPPDK